MGGGLNFLNKKTWHPARPQNLEEVWKREQKAAAEAKKAEELRKQLEEERKRSEFVQMAMDTGHLRKEERLDWMYASGLQAKQDAEKRREDMLTGKTDVALAPEQGPQEKSRAEQVALLPSFYASATPASQNETWLRLNNDPLFAIKRQQQEQLSKLKENPIKMMELLKNLTKAKEEEKKKDKKEKKDKKDKKDKKSRKRERESDSSDEDGDGGKAAKRSRSPPPSPSRYGSGSGAAAHERAAPPRAYHEHRPVGGARARSPAGRDERHGGGWGHEGHRSHQLQHHGATAAGAGFRDPDDPRVGPSGRREQERDRHDRQFDRQYDRGYDREYDRRAHEERDDEGRRDNRHDSRGGQGGGGGGGGGAGRHDDRRVRDWERDRDGERHRHRDYDGERQPDRERERERLRDRERDEGSGRDRPAQQQEQDRERRHGGEARRDMSGSGARGDTGGREQRLPDDRYGLKHSAVAPAALLQSDTGSRAAETRARLEEARRAREEEERTKAAARYVRKDYKTGTMTEEERQRRLAEMMGNAEEHEAQRRRRLDVAAAADAAEEGQRLVNQADAARGSDAFRDAAARDVYSKLGGSLEARINSRRHFSAC